MVFKQISNLVKSINDSDNLIANRYKLTKLLGKGAMGEVYGAEDTTFGNVKVAIKFLSQSLLDEKMRTRFAKEAQISALLGEQSLHIVKVKDYGLADNNVPFYVMEFLEGKSLDKVIKNKVISVGKFLSLTRQICLALECAHQGIIVNGELCPIVHRDIKPHNIFIVQEYSLNEVVKILDFGIAQIINPLQSGTQSFMGTPEYCSPEQMAEKELDQRSDLYNLGVMMYEMLTGEMPIKSDNHSFAGWYKAHHENIPKPLPRYLNIPKDLDQIVMQCLAKSPENRPQNAEEILKVINALDREYNSQIMSINANNNHGSKNILSLQEIYNQSSWPSDKPKKKIVFPVVTESKEGKFASLWTMLEAENIVKFNLNSNSTFCYSHFLFLNFPHPMLLWINLIYTPNYEPKWLPSYLDLKTELGDQIINILIKYKAYNILLFALNKPQKYQEILTVKISSEKKQQLETYLQKSNFWQGETQPEVSKQILKKQFEPLKQKILKAINKAKQS